MNDQDLQRFKENYQYEPEAFSLIEELHNTYGEGYISCHLEACDILHTLDKMEEVKKEMEEKFIVSVCATNESIEEKLQIDSLFPNLYLMIDYNNIIRMLVDKQWIEEFTLMKFRFPNDLYKVREKTIYAKGPKWDKCPKTIRDFLLGLKTVQGE